jgi:hypothetical protein
VLVDGQPRGETPLAVRGLALGAHIVAVSAPGLPLWQREVTLTSVRPSQSFDIVLGRPDGDGVPAGPAPEGVASRAAAATSEPPAAGGSVVQVDSRPPGAGVWMDGRRVGTTPLRLGGVAAGSRAIRIELPGYRPWTTTVEVKAGGTARVAASLEP